jgi:hypothetical protein
MSDPLLETDLPYRLGGGLIFDKRGHPVPAEMCLVKITPGEGWDVDVSMRGVQSKVSGPTPNHIVAILAERLEANNLKGVAESDLWVNLNIIWMGRVNPRHHRVLMSDMLHAVTTVSPSDQAGSTRIHHNADQWSDLAWGALELYLCQENYRWPTFNSLVAAMSVTFSPSLTPTLGDGRLHKRLTRWVTAVCTDPIYDREEARKWLKAARSEVMSEVYEGSPLWTR